MASMPVVTRASKGWMSLCDEPSTNRSAARTAWSRMSGQRPGCCSVTERWLSVGEALNEPSATGCYAVCERAGAVFERARAAGGEASRCGSEALRTLGRAARGFEPGTAPCEDWE